MRVLVICLVVACGGVENSAPPELDAGPGDAAVVVDGATTPGPRVCDHAAAWGAPVKVMGLATARSEESVRLSRDELTAYFQVYEGDDFNLYAARRGSTSEPFGAAMAIATTTTASSETDPSVSGDGLELWFGSPRVANQATHIYVATRPSTLAEFGVPGLAAGVNGSDVTQADVQPFITDDGEELWFASTRATSLGGFDIWVAKRSGGGFGAPQPVPALDSTVDDWLPSLSADRLEIYFMSLRPGPTAKGDFDIWTARRSTVNDGFAAPTLVDALNTAGGDRATWLSRDNCRIYGSTGGDIWMASR